jgi:hypothetical protein
VIQASPDDAAGFLPIPDWQRQILDERLADIETNPDAEQPWEEVKAELGFTGDRTSS